jgi:hypothetical protein
MVGKISILNVVPMKLFQFMRRMDHDYEAAYMAAVDMKHISPDAMDLAKSQGIDPLETEERMYGFMEEIESRRERIYALIQHLNENTDQIDEVVMEGLIHGSQF